MIIKPIGIMPQNIIDKLYKNFNLDSLIIPKVFKADSNPCFKCEAMNKIPITYKAAVNL